MPAQRSQKIHQKVFGQNFLVDQKLCEKIVQGYLQLAKDSGAKTLLEIGPGKGALTTFLLRDFSVNRKFENAVICEKDHVLALNLKEKIPGQVSEKLRDQVKLYDCDFLDLPLENWNLDGGVAVLSNLPYSVSTVILERLAREGTEVRCMVLMFQKEVALKARALEKDSERGRISVSIQNRWEVKKLLDVPPGAFQPRPKVMSQVVSLTRKPKPQIEFSKNDSAGIQFEKLLTLAFAHPRRMLRSNLGSDTSAADALERSGVNPEKRPHELLWSEWKQLYENYR